LRKKKSVGEVLTKSGEFVVASSLASYSIFQFHSLHIGNQFCKESNGFDRKD